MSWLKRAAKSSISKASSAIKTVAAVAAGRDEIDDRLPREQRLREHMASMRSFADFAEAVVAEGAAGIDWERMAEGERIVEALEGVVKVLEEENSGAGVKDDPGSIPCTLSFIEENGMGTLLRLAALPQSVNLQRAVLRTTVRLLRLRYELVENGSVARVVLRIAWRVERAPLRPPCAAAHCELLAAIADKLLRSPLALLPVALDVGRAPSGGADAAAAAAGSLSPSAAASAEEGDELPPLTWCVLHTDDLEGGAHAQRGILLLLQVRPARPADLTEPGEGDRPHARAARRGPADPGRARGRRGPAQRAGGARGGRGRGGIRGRDGPRGSTAGVLFLSALKLSSAPDSRCNAGNVAVRGRVMRETQRFADAARLMRPRAPPRAQGGLDEVGVARPRPDGASFFAAMRFIDRLLATARAPARPPPPVLTGHVSSLPPVLTGRVMARPRTHVGLTTSSSFMESIRSTTASRNAPPRPRARTRTRARTRARALRAGVLIAPTGSVGPQKRAPPHPRTNRTRRVPHPVLIGHAASLTLY
jgi:hypothetical protein